jgi:hypothetical protein
MPTIGAGIQSVNRINNDEDVAAALQRLLR